MSIRYESRLPAPHDFWRLFATTGWNDEYHLSPDELYDAISQNWHAISAYCDNKFVGFGRVVSDGVLHAMIYDLIVDPECQGKGIGAEILKRLVDACKAANIRDIQLFSARGKREFYEKRGFRARADEAPGMEYVAPEA
jgi:GNAT superfamily N-acetyltransferase